MTKGSGNGLGSGVRWREQLRQALEGVVARPSRLVLTTLGIALGLAALVATLGIATTASAQVSSRFDAIAATQVAVQPQDSNAPTSVAGDPPTMPVDSADRVSRLAGVIAAGTITPIVGTGTVRTVPIVDPTGIADPTLPVLAVSPGIFDAVLAHVVAGRVFDAGHAARADAVVVLGANAANRLGINRVDSAPAIFIGDRPFTVIGIVDGMVRHSELLDGIAMPEPTAARLYGWASPSALQIRTAAGAAALVAHQSPIALAPNAPSTMAASAPPAATDLRSGVQADVDALFVVLGAVTLLAGGVGIANVMLLAVLERIGEIGLRRALGATRRNIAGQFVTESGLVGALGGLIGGSAGLLVTLAVAASRHWTPVFDARLAAGAPLLGLIIGVVAGAFPAWRAARIEPIAALRATT
jgi:putative ABC transport system permease protein